ncbi:peptidase M19 [Colwellia sp. 75C3]|uniref:membrane dipeptidase n=1 Tax=Colwellia sp. 75C3 TaxID=888425 RepID=UPI000C33B00C|nr:membrane dipeptidase [Colwellia sp. 75C3]PKG83160.1 peptidase M19 [Colwellia sp. 75C3]
MERREFIKNIGLGVSASTLMACAAPIKMIAAQPEKRLFIDGLSFVPSDHNDIEASGLNAFIADISDIEAIARPDGSMNYKRTYQACMKSIKEKKTQLESSPEIFMIAKSGKDIETARKNNQCAVFLQIQGADCVEDGLQQVDEFYEQGLRVLQLTHHYNNVYAGGALSVGNAGLSNEGLALIDKLEAKHMLIDLSHSSDASAEQSLARAKGPIVQTHGAARAIINNSRCSPDHIIKGIAESGGVFGVFMMSWWLTNEKVPRSEHYINHLKHIKNIAGADAVAIANDYPLRGHEKALASGNNNKIAIDGYKQWWESIGKTGVLGFEREANHIIIPELNHIKRMHSIEYLLTKSGFTSNEIDKVMGQNWQRVLNDVLV